MNNHHKSEMIFINNSELTGATDVYVCDLFLLDGSAIDAEIAVTDMYHVKVRSIDPRIPLGLRERSGVRTYCLYSYPASATIIFSWEFIPSLGGTIWQACPRVLVGETVKLLRTTHFRMLQIVVAEGCCLESVRGTAREEAPRERFSESANKFAS